MVDEVEIKNVGGRNGVASEATLASLVSTLSGGNSTRERQLRLESLARTANTRTITESGKQQSVLTKAVVGTAKYAGGLIKQFAVGENRMGDFSQAIFGAQSSITGLVRAVDGLIDNYRELSAVGAGFNNSMYDFIKSSAESGMSLNEYSSFIMQNTASMRALGGNVTDGAKRFGEISKILRNNFGKELSRVGMSMEEMNSVLIDYTDFSTGRIGKETRSNFQLARGAANYASELDKLSKLTGVSRKQLAEQMNQQQADQRVRIAMAGMTQTEQENFSMALTMASNTVDDTFKQSLIDMSDNLPDDEITQKMTLASNTFANYADDVENMDVTELAKFNRDVVNELDAFTKTQQYQALVRSNPIYGMIGDMAAAGRGIGDATDDQLEAIVAQQTAFDSLSGVLLNFETALNNLKTFILDEIIGSEAFKQLELFGSELVKLFSAMFGDSGAGTKAKDGFLSMSDALIGPDGLITGGIIALRNEIAEFTAYLNAGGDPTEYLMNGLRNVADAVYNWFKELFFGTTKEVGPGHKQVQVTPGLFDNMVSAFSDFWEGPYGRDMADKIIDFFADIAAKILDKTFGTDGVIDAATGGVAGSGGTTAQIDSLIKKMESGQQLAQEEMDQIISFTAETARAQAVAQGGFSTLLGRTGQFTGALTDWGTDLIGTGMDQETLKYMAKQASETAKLLESKNYDLRTDTAQPEGITLDPSAGFANGTSGFQNFGDHTTTNLHGVEAVVPRNTNAGEYLAKHFGNDWNASPAKGAMQQAAPNQESLVKHVNQLNNTMMMVLSEMRKNNELEKKTMNSVKGLSGDLYRGI